MSIKIILIKKPCIWVRSVHFYVYMLHLKSYFFVLHLIFNKWKSSLKSVQLILQGMRIRQIGGKNAVHTIENNYIIGFSFEDFNTLNWSWSPLQTCMPISYDNLIIDFMQIAVLMTWYMIITDFVLQNCQLIN